MENMRAEDIKAGMCLTTLSGQAPGTIQKILTAEIVLKKGVFNPFTLTGDLVVNGVVASSHSEWFLDSIAESLGLVHLLPTVYQAVLAPARGLYHMVGPQAARQELEEYATEMAAATDQNLVIKPYFDLAFLKPYASFPEPFLLMDY